MSCAPVVAPTACPFPQPGATHTIATTSAMQRQPLVMSSHLLLCLAPCPSTPGCTASKGPTRGPLLRSRSRTARPRRPPASPHSDQARARQGWRLERCRRVGNCRTVGRFVARGHFLQHVPMLYDKVALEPEKVGGNEGLAAA